MEVSAEVAKVLKFITAKRDGYLAEIPNCHYTTATELQEKVDVLSSLIDDIWYEFQIIEHKVASKH